ncbi:MAG: hypothetical protein Q9187_001779 [Circinaria calcarea]
MSGLVGYDSSDGGEESNGTEEPQVKASTDLDSIHSLSSNAQARVPNGHTELGADDILTTGPTRSQDADNGNYIGPSSQSLSALTTFGGGLVPQSPYSANRAMTRDLTLPTIPNLDIPPSPTGSPPPGIDQKFSHFLELKRQGVHFNEKLARSSALKNPSLFMKLMDFAGIEEDDQYTTTLSEGLWDPTGFPPWAYKEELAKSQQQVLKQKEQERARIQRESIEFLSASASGNSSRAATPSGLGATKGLRGSASERVMAGLDRERLRSPQISNLVTRSGVERKGPRDDIYGPYDPSYLHSTGPKQHTQSPIVTGTSVIAVKFKDGVVIAADNLASYGSLARFTDVKRLRPFNETAIVGVSGDVSDMQYLDRLLQTLSTRENYSSAGHGLHARNLHTYLAKVMYKRRSDINPLWNQILVAGLDGDDKPFLSSVDLLGTTFSAPTLATGFGAHLAQPLLRKLVDDESKVEGVSREQAVEAVKQCMKVLFYRDARSLDQYSIAVVTKEGGVELKENEQLEGQSWAFAETIKGYGTQVV